MLSNYDRSRSKFELSSPSAIFESDEEAKDSMNSSISLGNIKEDFISCSYFIISYELSLNFTFESYLFVSFNSWIGKLLSAWDLVSLKLLFLILGVKLDFLEKTGVTFFSSSSLEPPSRSNFFKSFPF